MFYIYKKICLFTHTLPLALSAIAFAPTIPTATTVSVVAAADTVVEIAVPIATAPVATIGAATATIGTAITVAAATPIPKRIFLYVCLLFISLSISLRINCLFVEIYYHYFL